MKPEHHLEKLKVEAFQQAVPAVCSVSSKQIVYLGEFIYGPFLEEVFLTIKILQSNICSKKLTRKYKLADFFERIMGCLTVTFLE